MLLVETSPFVCTCVCNCLAATQALPTTTTDQPAQIRAHLHDDTYHLTDNTLKMPVDVENGENDWTDDSTNDDPLIETASISSVETIPLTISEEDDNKPIPYLGDPFQVGSDITEVPFGVMPGQVLHSHEWHTLVTNQAGFDRTNFTTLEAETIEGKSIISSSE